MNHVSFHVRGLCVLAALLLFLLSDAAQAQEDALTQFKKSMVDELPERVEKSLDHLLEAAGNDMVRLDVDRIKPLLAFVDDNVVDPKRVDMDRRYGSRGMCREFDLAVGLDRLMQYLANPDIPYNLLMPMVVSLNTTQPGSDLLRLDKPLWEHLDDLDEPVILRGVEREASVPTKDSGGWYAYDLNRLMVLLNFRGRPALVQVSVQRGQSTVGKKGAVLDEHDWLYFLSGESGLNRSGLGWADTYIYDSAGVYVFLQNEQGTAVHAANLKWLSAGWKGINAVGRDDLLDGSDQTVKFLNQVLSVWPEPGELARISTWAQGLSGAELDRLGRAYALDFEKLAKASEAMDDSDFQDEIADGGYATVLSPQALRAQLSVERLKCLLGMPALGGLCDEPLPGGDSVAGDAVQAVDQARGQMTDPASKKTTNATANATPGTTPGTTADQAVPPQ